MAVTHDKGVTYSPSVDVGALAGINYSVFPAATAGDAGARRWPSSVRLITGRTPTTRACHSPGVWYLYIATTYDGGNTWFVANATPDNPIQGAFGGIGNGGDGRNHYDFIDAQIDTQGRVIASNSIGCAAACVNNGGPNTFSKLAGIVRQSGGRRMYGSSTRRSRHCRQRRCLTATAPNVVLNWPEPDGSGLPITGYNVYRKIDNGAETQILSVTPSATWWIPLTQRTANLSRHRGEQRGGGSIQQYVRADGRPKRAATAILVQSAGSGLHRPHRRRSCIS